MKGLRYRNRVRKQHIFDDLGVHSISPRLCIDKVPFTEDITIENDTVFTEIGNRRIEI